MSTSQKNKNAKEFAKANSTHSPANRSQTKLRALFALIVCIGLGLTYALWTSTNDTAPTNVVSKKSASAEFLSMPQSSMKADTAAPLALEENKRRALAHFDEVSKTYCSYLENTKYPNYSRPIALHPDQVFPNQAIKESHPMRNHYGGADRSISLETSQSRVYLAANESVEIALKAVDQNGNPQALEIESANARGLVFGNKSSPPPLPIAFNSNQATSQITRFSPASTSFARFDGTIRIDVNYRVNDKRGQVFFDFIYSPEVPAVWSGKIREANENGDLKFYLPVSIKIAGRYLASARLDDAKGKPVAYLSFNEELKQGDTEIPLVVAGKLIRDQELKFPVSLRDIEAYLLKENVDPDRLLMPRLEGTQYQSKVYPLKNFSNEEWQSEERTRYLTEFGKDMQLARSHLVALDPQAERQAKIQEPCNPQNVRNAP